MSAFWKILTDILLQTSLAFIAVGCAVSLLVGIAMLVRPAKVFQLNQELDKWFATHKLEAALNKSHGTERFVYGNQRLIGAVILLAALYVLYAFGAGHMRPAVLVGLLGLRMDGWLASAMLWFLAVGGIAAAALGVLLLIWPAALKGLDAWANQWSSTDRFSVLLDQVHYHPDRFVARHARWVGGLVVAGSLYALAVLGFFLI